MDIQRMLINIANKVKIKVSEELKIRPISEDEGLKIDIELENMILNEIKKHYSEFTFIGEETGIHVYGSGKPIFIVDPLDGSVNAYRGYPIYSISIAVALSNKFKDIFCGIVVNLVTGDKFIGVKGMGVTLNGKPVRTSNIRKLNEALIAVDMNIRGKYYKHLKIITPIIIEAKHVRFIGTDALETCFVAAGICDAFIDLRGVLRLTDFAAACFMVKEAGGIILNEFGEELDFEFNDNIRLSYMAIANEHLRNEIIYRIMKSL